MFIHYKFMKSNKLEKLLIILSFLILSDCSNNSNVLLPFDQMSNRQIAYASLSEQEKSTIINWQNGKVEEGVYQSFNKSNAIVLNSGDKIFFGTISSTVKLIEGQKLIAVTFNTTDDALLGPLIVIIEPNYNKVIGGVLRN